MCTHATRAKRALVLNDEVEARMVLGTSRALHTLPERLKAFQSRSGGEDSFSALGRSCDVWHSVMRLKMYLTTPSSTTKSR